MVEGGAGGLQKLVRVYSRPEDVGNLASPANFARFQFHTLFPQLSQAIYLDADTVVLGDIAQVWRRLAESKELLVAVPRWVLTHHGQGSTGIVHLAIKPLQVLLLAYSRVCLQGVSKLWQHVLRQGEAALPAEVSTWLCCCLVTSQGLSEPIKMLHLAPRLEVQILIYVANSIPLLNKSTASPVKM